MEDKGPKSDASLPETFTLSSISGDENLSNENTAENFHANLDLIEILPSPTSFADVDPEKDVENSQWSGFRSETSQGRTRTGDVDLAVLSSVMAGVAASTVRTKMERSTSPAKQENGSGWFGSDGHILHQSRSSSPKHWDSALDHRLVAQELTFVTEHCTISLSLAKKYPHTALIALRLGISKLQSSPSQKDTSESTSRCSGTPPQTATRPVVEPLPDTQIVTCDAVPLSNMAHGDASGCADLHHRDTNMNPVEIAELHTSTNAPIGKEKAQDSTSHLEATTSFGMQDGTRLSPLQIAPLSPSLDLPQAPEESLEEPQGVPSRSDMVVTETASHNASAAAPSGLEPQASHGFSANGLSSASEPSQNTTRPTSQPLRSADDAHGELRAAEDEQRRLHKTSSLPESPVVLQTREDEETCPPKRSEPQASISASASQPVTTHIPPTNTSSLSTPSNGQTPPLPRICTVSSCRVILPPHYKFVRCETHVQKAREYRKRRAEKDKAEKAMIIAGVVGIGHDTESVPGRVEATVQEPAAVPVMERRNHHAPTRFSCENCENLLVPGKQWRNCEECRRRVALERRDTRVALQEAVTPEAVGPGQLDPGAVHADGNRNMAENDTEGEVDSQVPERPTVPKSSTRTYTNLPTQMLASTAAAFKVAPQLPNLSVDMTPSLGAIFRFSAPAVTSPTSAHPDGSLLVHRLNANNISCLDRPYDQGVCSKEGVKSTSTSGIDVSDESRTAMPLTTAFAGYVPSTVHSAIGRLLASNPRLCVEDILGSGVLGCRGEGEKERRPTDTNQMNVDLDVAGGGTEPNCEETPPTTTENMSANKPTSNASGCETAPPVVSESRSPPTSTPSSSTIVRADTQTTTDSETEQPSSSLSSGAGSPTSKEPSVAHELCSSASTPLLANRPISHSGPYSHHSYPAGFSMPYPYASTDFHLPTPIPLSTVNGSVQESSHAALWYSNPPLNYQYSYGSHGSYPHTYQASPPTGRPPDYRAHLAYQPQDGSYLDQSASPTAEIGKKEKRSQKVGKSQETQKIEENKNEKNWHEVKPQQPTEKRIIQQRNARGEPLSMDTDSRTDHTASSPLLRDLALDYTTLPLPVALSSRGHWLEETETTSPTSRERRCNNISCRRHLPADNVGVVCEKCRSKFKKRQEKTKKKFKLVPTQLASEKLGKMRGEV